MDFKDELDFRILHKMGIVPFTIYLKSINFVQLILFKKLVDKYVLKSDKFTEKQKNLIRNFFKLEYMAFIFGIYQVINFYDQIRKKKVIDESNDEVGKGLIETMGYKENKIEIKKLPVDDNLLRIDNPEYKNHNINDGEIVKNLLEIPDYDFHSTKTGEFLYDTRKNTEFLKEFWNYLKTYDANDVEQCFRFDGETNLLLAILFIDTKLKNRHAKFYKNIIWEEKTDSGNLRGLHAPSFVAFGKYFRESKFDFVFKLIPAYTDEHFTNVGDFFIQDIFKDITYGFYGGGKIMLPTKTGPQLHTFLLMEKIEYIPNNEYISVDNLIKCGLDILQLHKTLASGDWLHGDAHIDNNIFCYDSDKNPKGVLIDYGNSFRISKIKNIDLYEENAKMILFMNIIDPIFSVLMKIIKSCLFNLNLIYDMSSSYNLENNFTSSLQKGIYLDKQFNEYMKKLGNYYYLKNLYSIQYIFVKQIKMSIVTKTLVKIKTQNIFKDNEKGKPAHKNIDYFVNRLITYIDICNNDMYDMPKIRHIADILINGIKKVTELWNSRKEISGIKKIYAETYANLLELSKPAPKPVSGAGIAESGMNFYCIILIVVIIILLILLIVLSVFRPFPRVFQFEQGVQARFVYNI